MIWWGPKYVLIIYRGITITLNRPELRILKKKFDLSTFPPDKENNDILCPGFVSGSYGTTSDAWEI